MERDKERISSVLKNIGYYFPKIDIFIEDLKDNKINLTYKIEISRAFVSLIVAKLKQM